jgi:NAD-dependent dihydropyrimidine dehydrogenase PreA subunit
MTYIIAEPCIDIKDLSCVDVCPVDCIHQAERILVIDPEECIDCFAPTEEFLTPYGLRTFAEVENKAVRVLTDDGFKPAYVRRFRRKPLVDITLAPMFEERDRRGGTRPKTRKSSTFRKNVLATPTHGWLLADGERTDSLAAGQLLPSTCVRAKRDSELYRLGVLHGLVFADGSWNKLEIASGEHLHYVQLHGDRVGRYKEFFDQVDFSPRVDVPGYVGTGVVHSPVNLKRALPATADAEYVAGFVDGWLASDGDQVEAGSWCLRSTQHEALDWLERAAPFAGYITIGSGEESSLETGGFGLRSRPLRRLYLATREVYWRVLSVAPVEAEEDDTFCAVVPGKHTFTLSGGVTTRNCGACEPECPVEAIFPEDALPDKWQPFVEINYAYGKGLDVVNELTDKYATEHNVQNPPLE